jgi:hypothetical protein
VSRKKMAEDRGLKMDDRIPTLVILYPPSSILDELEYDSSASAKDRMT